MKFEHDSRGPGRVIDKRGQPKPKLDPDKIFKYKLGPPTTSQMANRVGLSAPSPRSRAASGWTLGSPKRPGPSRKRPR